MALNITSNMTSDQILEVAHSALGIPSLVISWIVTVLIFLFIGLVSIDGSKGQHPYQKFIIIWIISTIFAGLIILFFTLTPEVILNITDFYSSIWN